MIPDQFFLEPRLGARFALHDRDGGLSAKFLRGD